MTRTKRTREMVECALFAAVMAVLSPFTIPVGPVPVTLATFAVMLCGVVLRAKTAALATLGYLLLGLVGLPVFSGAQGGFGVFLGPTGGYLWSYVFLAVITSFLSHRPARTRRGETALAALGGLLGTAVCYLCGTAQYILLMDVTPGAAVAVCVLPFLPFDAVKIVLAAALGTAVRRGVGKARREQ